MIRAENLVVGQGEFLSEPFRLKIEKPGLYAIEGENGSGKTTLLKTLIGRLPKQKGQLLVNFKSMATAGLEPGLFEHWTVRENICFYEELRRSPLQQEKTAWIQSYQRLRVSQLSSGMKRQVELAIAFGLDTQYLFLDEPFHYLDRKNREVLKTWITETQSKKTILMSLHHQNDYELQFSGGIKL